MNGAPFVAHLPNGGKVELLAGKLSSSGANEPWWQPDGSPSTFGADIDVEGKYGVTHRVLALARIQWPPPKESDESANFTSGTGLRFAARYQRRIQMNGFGVTFFDQIAASENEVTLYLKVGANAWQTVILQKLSLLPYLLDGAGRRGWYFSETPNGNLNITTRNVVLNEAMEYRLLAVDEDGKKYYPSTTKTTTDSASPTLEAVFDGTTGTQGALSSKRTREVHWQSRPFELVEFRHVSLKQGYHTRLEVKDFSSKPLTTLKKSGNKLYPLNPECRK